MYICFQFHRIKFGFDKRNNRTVESSNLIFRTVIKAWKRNFCMNLDTIKQLLCSSYWNLIRQMLRLLCFFGKEVPNSSKAESKKVKTRKPLVFSLLLFFFRKLGTSKRVMISGESWFWCFLIFSDSMSYQWDQANFGFIHK